MGLKVIGNKAPKGEVIILSLLLVLSQLWRGPESVRCAKAYYGVHTTKELASS